MLVTLYITACAHRHVGKTKTACAHRHVGKTITAWAQKHVGLVKL